MATSVYFLKDYNEPRKDGGTFSSIGGACKITSKIRKVRNS